VSRRVLIIEDDRDLSALVALHVRDLGCDVVQARNGTTGLTHALSGGIDLIVLDLMLPDLDGVEVCRRIRAEGGYVPILMLTARNSEVDRVLGLEIGADDYLTKPFSVRELMARIKALFRRVEAMAGRDDETPSVIRVGDVTIDESRRHVTIHDAEVRLTAKEFDLLSMFARNPGRVFTRAQLLERVWGYGHDGYEHTVNSHINRLRSKIEPDPSSPRYLLTVWGVGYRFFDPRAELSGAADAG